LVPARGYQLELIEPVPLPRRINRDLFSLPFRLSRTIKAVRKIMRAHDVQVVVGFGGYVALPVYLAAKGKVPIVVHEANAKPGLANKVGAKFAQVVAQTYEASLPGAVRTGLPLRAQIEHLDRDALRDSAREYFGLPLGAKVILVFGGSQGARRINDAISQFNSLGENSVAILHAVGLANALPEGSFSYYPVAYIDRMDLAYAAADFVVARSGAMTVAEVTSVGLPACFVPFPIGNGEQEFNAEPVVEAGGAIICRDADFSAEYFRKTILPIVGNDAELSRMSQASRNYRVVDAAGELANLVEPFLAVKDVV
jgi:UDP-N-acetylglucosamine--N-acetylmuramyl-(pentapeptide) pyrophosphoryl-undecaprenol N-acetylglucosamine transferase